MEERKVLIAGTIVEKQLYYFKIWDSEIVVTQRGLVQAINGLFAAIVEAYSKRVVSEHDFNIGGSQWWTARSGPLHWPHSPDAVPKGVENTSLIGTATVVYNGHDGGTLQQSPAPDTEM
jgi:hypothetical protein